MYSAWGIINKRSKMDALKNETAMKAMAKMYNEQQNKSDCNEVYKPKYQI